MAKAKVVRDAPVPGGTTRIRTTINPREVIEVGDAELLDLERQGLVHSRVTDKTPTTADERKVPGELTPPTVPATGGDGA